jgi:hypothetical protein
MPSPNLIFDCPNSGYSRIHRNNRAGNFTVNDESQDGLDKGDVKILDRDASDEELEKAAESMTLTVPIPYTITSVLPACTGC